MDAEEIEKSAALEHRHWWYAARRALVDKPTLTDLTIDLAAPDAPRTLRDLGARGGRIVALNGTTALALTP